MDTYISDNYEINNYLASIHNDVMNCKSRIATCTGIVRHNGDLELVNFYEALDILNNLCNSVNALAESVKHIADDFSDFKIETCKTFDDLYIKNMQLTDKLNRRTSAFAIIGGQNASDISGRQDKESTPDSEEIKKEIP